jgi:hypothetical protein
MREGTQVHEPFAGRMNVSQQVSNRSTKFLLFALAFLLSALYMGWELKRGWVPSDEGTLAQSAERVLEGQLPHRDFHEGYTGALGYLNAAAFHLFGLNLASMRYMMFLFFLLWVPVFYYAVSRFISGPFTSVVTLLAVAWGPPNYGAAMPSWYNLFFATFGLAALLRYIEVSRKRWLFLSGFCGGISLLFKLPGLFFVSGALLFLVFREQTMLHAPTTVNKKSPGYRIFVVTCIILYEILLVAVLRKVANFVTYLYFWIPELAIGGVLVWHEFRTAKAEGNRFASSMHELGPFSAGFASPIALFLLPYVFTGSVGSVINDIFTVSARLVEQASMKPPEVWFLEGCVANLLLLGMLLLTHSKGKANVWELVVLGIPIAILIPLTLILARRSKYLYQLLWSTIWVLAPVITLIGVWLLVASSLHERVDFKQRQKLFVTLSVMGACSLIQFPFSNTIYFCYVAPLVILGATAIVGVMDDPPTMALGGMICFCFLFAVLELTPGFVYHLGVDYTSDMQKASLSLPRGGGLRVTAESAQEYEQLIDIIREHARGEYILAKPDSPEVYFLSGFRNPTDTFFDFYEDSTGRAQRALEAIHSHDINLIVLNHRPPFAGPISADFQAAVEQEFPNRADAGDFEVRWKP